MNSQEIIIAYSKDPHNKKILKNTTIRYKETNRVCADVVEVFLIIEESILKKMSFDGYMSIIATACTAITGEILEGWDIDEVLKLDETFIHENIGDDISPRRRFASLLGLLAIKNAIHEYKHDGKKEDFSDIVIE